MALCLTICVAECRALSPYVWGSVKSQNGDTVSTTVSPSGIVKMSAFVG